MTIFVWFKSIRGAKIAFFAFGGAMLFCLILGALFWARDAQIQRDFILVTGHVVDNFIREGFSSWSDVQFELGGQIHTVRHNHFWLMGHQREFLVNPYNPEQSIVATTLGGSRMIALVSAIPLSLFTLFYLTNFLINRKRDKKMIKNVH